MWVVAFDPDTGDAVAAASGRRTRTFSMVTGVVEVDGRAVDGQHRRPVPGWSTSPRPRSDRCHRLVPATRACNSASGIKPLTCRFKPSEPPRSTKEVRTARLAPRLRPDTGKSNIMKNLTLTTTAAAALSAAVLGLAAPAVAAPSGAGDAQQTIAQLEDQGNRVIVNRQSSSPAERRQRRRHPPGIPDPGIHLGPAARRPHPRNRRPRHLRRRQVTPTPQRGAPNGGAPFGMLGPRSTPELWKAVSGLRPRPLVSISARACRADLPRR